jgi:hypothetical protein
MEHLPSNPTMRPTGSSNSPSIGTRTNCSGANHSRQSYCATQYWWGFKVKLFAKYQNTVQCTPRPITRSDGAGTIRHTRSQSYDCRPIRSCDGDLLLSSSSNLELRWPCRCRIDRFDSCRRQVCDTPRRTNHKLLRAACSLLIQTTDLKSAL